MVCWWPGVSIERGVNFNSCTMMSSARWPLQRSVWTPACTGNASRSNTVTAANVNERDRADVSIGTGLDWKLQAGGPRLHKPLPCGRIAEPKHFLLQCSVEKCRWVQLRSYSRCGA